jgi:protein O-GlcNAc transferase
MVNVFSFCIYGPETQKYYGGLLENVRLINQHYPSWKIYVYAGADVSDTLLATLRANPSVVVFQTGIHGSLNTIYRFFAIDDPEVDVAFFRDADSRIHWKDRWAINDFLASGHMTHIIRDHEQHATSILAGLWGLRKGAFQGSIRMAFQKWTPVHAGSGDPNDPTSFGMDQNFLWRVIYPTLRPNALVHYSNHMLFIGEVGKEFPFAWSEDVFCGKVELEAGPSSDVAPRELRVSTLPFRISALNFLPKR